MKKAAIIFVIILLSTLLIPLLSAVSTKEESKTELPTIFSSSLGIAADSLNFGVDNC